MSNGNNIHKCIVFPTWQYWLHWVPCVLQNDAASNSGDAQTLWELRVVWINWVSVVQASSFCSDTILIVKLSKIWMPSRNTNCIIYKQIYHKQLKTLASCKQCQYAQFWRIDLLWWNNLVSFKCHQIEMKSGNAPEECLSEFDIWDLGSFIQVWQRRQNLVIGGHVLGCFEIYEDFVVDSCCLAWHVSYWLTLLWFSSHKSHRIDVAPFRKHFHASWI